MFKQRLKTFILHLIGIPLGILVMSVWIAFIWAISEYTPFLEILTILLDKYQYYILGIVVLCFSLAAIWKFVY
ncbi:hypothetical protein IJ22_17620 [Paenibacillus naphthalenovorans]|uniref:Uncharacterized protein n=1 Tax=Paenibacillus naphthalenovorans TaxID=162209 RepID=A0A0U2U7I0_9BACL|nr:hypothetical protein IJ22_17620 [Paenibacillus naphthalenovorans]